MQHQRLLRTAGILLVVVLAVIILKFGKPFLVPLAFAGILAMLLLPVCSWLQSKGVNKAIATVLSILLMVGLFAGVIAFLGWQISDLAEDAGKVKQQATEKYQQVQQYISDQLGVSPEKQKEMVKEQQKSSGGKSGFVSGFIGGLGGMVTNGLLVLVYIFLFLYFREHLQRFVIRLVPHQEKGEAVKVVDNIQQVAQKYLSGLSQMIVGLWIMYGIAFTIIGVKNALFFAVLCGMLEIIPFVGNLVGNLLTIAMAITQGGGTNMIIGILVTYGLIQFIQSYILEPLVVGAEVNINPLFTIVGLVAGELVWGIPGMVLAIPLLGMTKIIFDHIEPLKPFGELIGEEKRKPNKLKKKTTEIVEKFKKRFSKNSKRAKTRKPVEV
ncbi:MAG TPA: AI-2E family transporter [Chryseolinea sp.]|nr:AI-2E family transporter [Chryseolinea sp.]